MIKRYVKLMKEEKDDTELSISQKKKLAGWITNKAIGAVSDLYSDKNLRELQKTVLGASLENEEDLKLINKQIKLINEVAQDMIGEFKKHIKRQGKFPDTSFN